MAADDTKIHGIQFEISGNATKASEALKRLKKTMEELKGVTGSVSLSPVAKELKDFSAQASKTGKNKISDVIDYTKVSRSLKSVNSALKDTERQTDELQSKLEALSFGSMVKGVSATKMLGDETEKEIETITSEIKSLEELRGRLASQKEGILGSISGNKTVAEDFGAQETVASVRELEQAAGTVADSFREADTSAKSFFSSLDISAITSTSKMKLLQIQIDSMKSKLQEGISSGEWDDEKIASYTSRIQQLTAQMKKLEEEERRIGDSTKEVGEKFNFASSKIGKFVTSLKRIMMYRAIRSILSGITQAIKVGIDNMYEYSRVAGTDFANAMDRAKSATTTWKSSIAAAVTPIINTLIPVFEKVMKWLVEFNNKIGAFFAALSGKESYEAAIWYTDQYKESTQETTAAVKELQKYIAPFDELNILPDVSSTSSGSASNIPNYSSMFETRKTPEWAQEWGAFLDKMKQRWQDFKNGWSDWLEERKQKWQEFKDGISEWLDKLEQRWQEFKESLKRFNVSTIIEILPSFIFPSVGIIEAASSWVAEQIKELSVEVPTALTITPSFSFSSSGIVKIITDWITERLNGLTVDLPVVLSLVASIVFPVTSTKINILSKIVSSLSNLSVDIPVEVNANVSDVNVSVDQSLYDNMISETLPLIKPDSLILETLPLQNSNDLGEKIVGIIEAGILAALLAASGGSGGGEIINISSLLGTSEAALAIPFTADITDFRDDILLEDKLTKEWKAIIENSDDKLSSNDKTINDGKLNVSELYVPHPHISDVTAEVSKIVTKPNTPLKVYDLSGELTSLDTARTHGLVVPNLFGSITGLDTDQLDRNNWAILDLYGELDVLTKGANLDTTITGITAEFGEADVHKLNGMSISTMASLDSSNFSPSWKRPSAYTTALFYDSGFASGWSIPWAYMRGYFNSYASNSTSGAAYWTSTPWAYMKGYFGTYNSTSTDGAAFWTGTPWAYMKGYFNSFNSTSTSGAAFWTGTPWAYMKGYFNDSDFASSWSKPSAYAKALFNDYYGQNGYLLPSYLGIPSALAKATFYDWGTSWQGEYPWSYAKAYFNAGYIAKSNGSWVQLSVTADGGVFTNSGLKPIQQYASGGTASMGQLFIAREAGPELVGTLGGHTAVMNNDQIVASVSNGVAMANEVIVTALFAAANQIISAMREYSGGDGDIDIETIAKGVTAYQRRQARMSGRA